MKYESNRERIDAAIHEGTRRGLLAGAIHYQGSVKKQLNRHASNRGNGGQASPPGSPPGNRTGTLSRSVQVDVGGLIRGSQKRVKIGTDIIYARIHEFGGTIQAKGGGLAVPIHADAKRASDQGRGPRDFNDLTYISRPGKPPLLVRDKGGQWDIMYVLPKSVVMPARPVWRPTFKRELKKIKKHIKRRIDDAVRRAASGGAM